MVNRNDDPFAKYERIKRIREKYREKSHGNKTGLKQIREMIAKDTKAIKAADIFNALPADKQDELKEWY